MYFPLLYGTPGYESIYNLVWIGSLIGWSGLKHLINVFASECRCMYLIVDKWRAYSYVSVYV